MATVLRAPFVVPRPADHSDWRFAPKGSPLLATLLTSVKVYGVGGQAPTKAWHYDSDVGEGFWQGQPVDAAPLALLTAVKVFGAGGQAPNIRWRYDYLIDEPLWLGHPTSSALLAPLLTSSGQLKCRGWFLLSDDDAAAWSPVLARNFRLLNAAAAGTPFASVFYKFGGDDPPVWDARSRASALLAPLLTTAGQVKSRQWLWGQDESPSWTRTPARNFNLYNITSPTPLVNPPWKFGIDDASLWQGQPDNSAALQLLTAVKVFGAGGQAPTKTWHYDYLIDEPLWLGHATASALLAPLLTTGGQVKSRAWPFGFDDASGWNPVLSRNFELLIAPVAATPFGGASWKFSYDDHGVWLGHPTPSVVLLPFSIIGAVVLNPNLIAVGQTRYRIAIRTSNTMAQTRDLAPPMDAGVEVETITWDFGRVLASGVTITSIVSLTAAVYAGTDASASSRLIGSPVIVASPTSKGPLAAVSQLFGQALAGVTYRLQCVVNTSDGQTLSLWTHLYAVQPN